MCCIEAMVKIFSSTQFERWADKMREKVAMLDWLKPLYLVCQST